MNGSSKRRSGKVTVDNDGFLKVGCVKVGRVDGDKVVVHDKNRHRSRKTGSDQIEAPISDVVDALTSSSTKGSDDGSAAE